ncbi:hypothetical protein Cni_G01549 [Canna indica]|uniref:Uncharacterized protein n=1 Tax=Canna indica TaxID=4628 RepID=A0AAQ3Q1W5_9LILI|nr:hypothetical protein Cni_G01549 [Canna indica]
MDDIVYTQMLSSFLSFTKKLLLSSVSCDNASHVVKDVIALLKYPSSTSSALPKKPRPKMIEVQGQAVTKDHTLATIIAGCAELPARHSSQWVVEIVFSSCRSSGDGSAAAFPDEIEMLFRVLNPARTVARFEESPGEWCTTRECMQRAVVGGREGGGCAKIHRERRCVRKRGRWGRASGDAGVPGHHRTGNNRVRARVGGRVEKMEIFGVSFLFTSAYQWPVFLRLTMDGNGRPPWMEEEEWRERNRSEKGKMNERNRSIEEGKDE